MGLLTLLFWAAVIVVMCTLAPVILTVAVAVFLFAVLIYLVGFIAGQVTKKRPS